ncbi:hypothetical protein SESBI_11806 [Sesbania bispinosa]|nr:hypothetical protein SESBI_11806 [Sesbania bispinosa]
MGGVVIGLIEFVGDSVGKETNLGADHMAKLGLNQVDHLKVWYSPITTPRVLSHILVDAIGVYK